LVRGPDNNVIVNQDGNSISGEIPQSSTRISEIPENEKAGTEEPNSSQISRKELWNVIRGRGHKFKLNTEILFLIPPNITKMV